MPAETLNCPMCGASAATDASHCDHCGARLATVACPSCFGMIFAGAKYCSHCGARVDRSEFSPDKSYRCPRCRLLLKSIVLGSSPLLECQKCDGLWVDVALFEQICSDREKQSAVLGMPMVMSESGSNAMEVVRYVPCPICNQLMMRVNFARCSGVVVDVCKQHGSWFDRNELRRVVEFIRGGGLDKARSREKEELERERRLLQAERASYNPGGGAADIEIGGHDGVDLALGALGTALRTLLKF